ncbi:hypothetical protein HER31_08650 [Ferrimonas lipolytica]|uniref:ChrR-like cupin domain-containing protein n=2 Tax=Ferrimonas lipolytica TaxID=2724191 RepID=A0A6H1UIJ3_9GAMM|nr:hypothetical protein HER31_08650 [Ferrimonas lipolytica]
MAWQASPAVGVLRKRLFHRGGAESGVVSSIVRYEPNSDFAAHQHPQGEEILVLEGVFSDEHGDYPQGYHLLNPDGSCHTPFSQQGCTLWVKLRQYDGADRPLQHSDSINQGQWQQAEVGVSVKTLYQQRGYAEQICLVRLHCAEMTVTGPFELLLLSGELDDQFGNHTKLSYLRWSENSSLTVAASGDAEFYLCQYR